jgi:ubiquitin-activating enzyme E1
MNKIDTNLYSRQITTFGIDTMSKIQNLRILIVGMRGLGIEIAKNIILFGIKEVKILDQNKTLINDLGSNYFLSKENISKQRDISSLTKLKELNSYVNVDIFRENLEEKINDFDVIIITEIMDTKYLFHINELCHNKNISFIYCLTLGLSCYIFTDFGDKHIIIDPLGSERKLYFIKNIDKSGIITIDQRNGEDFDLSNGSYVKFKEIEGINELNDEKPRKIKYLSKNSFKLVENEENISYENYKVGGIIEEVILPEEKNYKKLKECFYIPYLEDLPEINDYTKEGRNELLHCALLAIHKFYDEEKKLPQINGLDDAMKVLSYAKSIYQKSQNKNEEWINNIENFEEEIVMNIAKWSQCEISPVCSFLGGIVSQEIIKATGKYIPINQWIWFDFFETIENLKENIDRTLIGSRYDDQIAIYGNDLQKKLNKLNIFIIGAGALGCEFLKNFSLMGISTEKESNTIITDNDLIEISNLNRQFLFHKKDIRKPKSKIAADKSKLMNKDFNCKNLELLVNNESENIFDEKFWKKQDFIFTAVDNKKARKYIDNQCTKYTKILIDT